MVKLIRTGAEVPAFQRLVRCLNAELAGRDGADHPLARYNPIADLKYVVLAYENDEAIGCGAMAAREETVMEIKRMYVTPRGRGRRIGEHILAELENWAGELGNHRCVLFTGSNQPEAHRLYRRKGYRPVPPYGKLGQIADCRCFAKDLRSVP